MKLSVAIITFNEENNIKRTLDAVYDIADEIIIVDSNSTDNTKRIALRYSKVRFFNEDFKGDGLQKQSAIDKCKGEWVLLIDADEEVTLRLKEKIKYLVLNNNAKYDVYTIRLVSIINMKVIRFGGWSKVTKRILFKRNSGQISPVAVHASWQTNSPIGFITESINHYLYRDPHHQIDKLNLYSTEQSKVNFQKGKKITLFKVVFIPFYHFIKMYIFRLGFLEYCIGKDRNRFF